MLLYAPPPPRLPLFSTGWLGLASPASPSWQPSSPCPDLQKPPLQVDRAALRQPAAAALHRCPAEKNLGRFTGIPDARPEPVLTKSIVSHQKSYMHPSKRRLFLVHLHRCARRSRWLARVQKAPCDRFKHLRKTVPVCECFPYVCPEPVLV